MGWPMAKWLMRLHVVCYNRATEAGGKGQEARNNCPLSPASNTNMNPTSTPSSTSTNQSTTKWFDWLIIFLMVSSLALLLVSLLAWQTPLRGGQVQLQVGKIAPYNIVAPSQIRYESQIRTEEARERAAQAVPDQYDSTEGRVRRQQIELAQAVLEQLTAIRNDPNATPTSQTDALLALEGMGLNAEQALHILTLSPADWDAVVAETPLALDRVMREEIRDNNLIAVRRRTPALVNTGLNEEASQVTTELTAALVRPNSILNEERTRALREQARSVVPIQFVALERGETIIRAGDRANEEDVEALAQVGLLQKGWDWWMLVRAVAFALAIMVTAIGCIWRLRHRTYESYQEMAALVMVTVIWLLMARFMIIPNDWLPYLYPLAALSMLVTVLVDLRVSVILTIAFALIVHYMGENNNLLATYVCVSGLAGALVLGRAERLSSFLWAGLSVSAANWLTFVAYRAPFTDYSAEGFVSGLIQLHLVVLLNGVLAASIALIGYYLLGNLFNITTSLQLAELSRPTHPLLRQLLLKAPGTYHHTIIVSNLAERAAAAIGADALLARVGAYYHDIGKTVRPYFFTENIADGPSPHEKLDPLTSAQIIISHVPDGIDLAQKYRLPMRIQDFIREHHGRTLTQYFYMQAQRQSTQISGQISGQISTQISGQIETSAGDMVSASDFRYPGPRPRSRETAILMLADTCEAAVRSVRPPTREMLEKLVHKLIDERIAGGELNESNLTFKELQTVREVFLQVLQGVHHPRIAYPEAVKTNLASEAAVPLRTTTVESTLPATGEPMTRPLVHGSTVNEVFSNGSTSQGSIGQATTGQATTSPSPAVGGVEDEVGIRLDTA